MRQPSAPVVLVTGCSSGIGRAICERLPQRGAKVYGASRTMCPAAGWNHVACDVSEQAAVAALVEHVLGREGRIDALVCSAGVSLAGAVEDTGDDEAQRHFAVNFFGTTRMIHAVLPAMRRQGAGKIIVIGSIGGLIGLPFLAYYSAAKFALDGLVEALRGEIGGFGVQATIVHPGDLNTAFSRNRVFTRNSLERSAYAGIFRKTLDFYAAQEDQAPPPHAVVRTVEKLLWRSTLPKRVIVGSLMERLGVLGKTVLPARSFEYLFRKAYGP